MLQGRRCVPSIIGDEVLPENDNYPDKQQPVSVAKTGNRKRQAWVAVIEPERLGKKPSDTGTNDHRIMKSEF